MTVSSLTANTAGPAAALEEKLFSQPWREQDFLESLKGADRRFFVCTEGEALVGCCGLQLAGEQGDVLTIGVDPAFRRRGAGKMLLQRLIQEASLCGVRTLFLEVRASNTAARTLYERAGFRCISCRKGYYRDPEEDGWVYSLEVESCIF